MRVVLEWLGLIEPDPARRDPVAVPAWAPYAVAAVTSLFVGGSAVLIRLVWRLFG